MTAEKTRRGRAGMGSNVGSNKKDPFAFSVRAWDAPLSIVETSLLAAYAHPPGAVNAIDVDRSAPFQRRATPVFHVPHGRMAVALMRAMSAAQGVLPAARDTGGKADAGRRRARARRDARGPARAARPRDGEPARGADCAAGGVGRRPLGTARAGRGRRARVVRRRGGRRSRASTSVRVRRAAARGGAERARGGGGGKRRRRRAAPGRRRRRRGGGGAGGGAGGGGAGGARRPLRATLGRDPAAGLLHAACRDAGHTHRVLAGARLLEAVPPPSQRGLPRFADACRPPPPIGAPPAGDAPVASRSRSRSRSRGG